MIFYTNCLLYSLKRHIIVDNKYEVNEMKTSVKLRELTLQNVLVIVTYIALLILAIINFKHIIEFISLIIDILMPFIIGFILAFILNIPMKFYYQKINIKDEKKKKTISAILAILTFIAVIVLLIIVVIPQVVDNVKQLITNMPEILNQAKLWLETLLNDLNISTDLINQIEDMQNNLGKTLFGYVSTWAPSIASGFTSLTTSVAHVFMGIIVAIYMLFSKEKLLRQINKIGKAYLNEKRYLQLKDICHLISETFENFLTGQIVEAFIIGILCYIGCKILDIPYASIAAFIIGFTNIIPYFGPIIGAVISCILILFVSPMKAIIFLIFSTCLQQFESNLIYPHVVGSSVGLSALWVLFAVSAGGGLFGIAGMVFGLPVFSVIYELFKRSTNQRLKEKEMAKAIAQSD